MWGVAGNMHRTQTLGSIMCGCLPPSVVAGALRTNVEQREHVILEHGNTTAIAARVAALVLCGDLIHLVSELTVEPEYVCEQRPSRDPKTCVLVASGRTLAPVACASTRRVSEESVATLSQGTISRKRHLLCGPLAYLRSLCVDSSSERVNQQTVNGWKHIDGNGGLQLQRPSHAATEPRAAAKAAARVAPGVVCYNPLSWFDRSASAARRYPCRAT